MVPPRPSPILPAKSLKNPGASSVHTPFRQLIDNVRRNLKLLFDVRPVVKSVKGERAGRQTADEVAVDVPRDVVLDHPVAVPVNRAGAGAVQGTGGLEAVDHDVPVSRRTTDARRLIEVGFIQSEPREARVVYAPLVVVDWYIRTC